MKIDDTVISRSSIHRCCVITIMALAEQNPNLDVGDGKVVQCAITRSSAHRLMLFRGAWVYLNPIEAERTPDVSRRKR